MNIFYLHEHPQLAASYVYDKHKVKMILESAQMLCTAHHVFGNGHNVPYKQAHLNHPSTIWVRESTHHYYWLYEHMLALGNEYTKRYGKKHLTIIKCEEPLLYAPNDMPTLPYKHPPQCMPDEYKRPHAIHGYWNYYINDKFKVCNKNETPYKTPPVRVMDDYFNGIGSSNIIFSNDDMGSRLATG